MKYKIAIFDLDGTILNTIEDLADSLNYALTKNGYKERTVAETQSFVGNGLLMLVKRAINPETSEEEAKKVLADLKVYYKIHCADKTKPYEGIPELLKDLKTAGYRLAVVSNKADYAVQILCEQYFPGMFDLAFGERENVRRKPAPDSVNAVLAEFELKKADAVYIGDSDVDIETAENVGTDSILVAWGFRGADFLREKGAKNIVFDTEELKRCLLE